MTRAWQRWLTTLQSSEAGGEHSECTTVPDHEPFRGASEVATRRGWGRAAKPPSRKGGGLISRSSAEKVGVFRSKPSEAGGDSPGAYFP